MADQSLTFRQAYIVERISEILINVPLPSEYHNIGQYYRALSVKRRYGVAALPISSLKVWLHLPRRLSGIEHELYRLLVHVILILVTQGKLCVFSWKQVMPHLQRMGTIF